MIVNMFAVYDLKAEAYMQPFFSQTKGLAIRSFSAAAYDGGSVISKYPEDFCLFCLGTWDDGTGMVSMLKAPVSLGTARDFMTQAPTVFNGKVADLSGAGSSAVSELRKAAS